MGIAQFPLSFAIRPNFTDVESTFWREKYNIQLIKGDAFDFALKLKISWFSETRKVISFEERRNTTFAEVDRCTSFPRVGDSFYRVVPSECTGSSDAELFFKGAEPSWADIRDGIPPKRDAYITLMEGLFADISDPVSPSSTYLIVGPAGTGKTTLVRAAAYEAVSGYGCSVFVHIAGAPLDARLLEPFLSPGNPSRLIVVVHHAGDYLHELQLFSEELRRRKLPVSLILEETLWLRTRCELAIAALKKVVCLSFIIPRAAREGLSARTAPQ